LDGWPLSHITIMPFLEVEGVAFYERDSICFALFVESLGCYTGRLQRQETTKI
jgi:hypothetical protein